MEEKRSVFLIAFVCFDIVVEYYDVLPINCYILDLRVRSDL